MQYTEFTAYAALLGGAAPQVLQDTLVMRHTQTWKLREHHLVRKADEKTLPISASDDDALTAFFPPGAYLRETDDGLEVEEPGRSQKLWYSRPGKANFDGEVVDIIITGEVSEMISILVFCAVLNNGDSSFPTTGSLELGQLQASRACEAMRWIYVIHKGICE
jgi:hypothetical protein